MVISFEGKELVSIHAPARGATQEEVIIANQFTVSIHAPARGATQVGCTYWQLDNVSIHAPARGATLSAQQKVSHTWFQSTLPHGERLV